jgi:plastocyanin
MQRRHVLIALLAVLFAFGCGSRFQQKGDQIMPEMNLKASTIVRAHYVGGLSPAELTIEPGTTVIWLNDSRESVTIAFEGKQVTMACKSPVHFIIDETGSFTSDLIPEGSVASLCFVERGEFNYVMQKDRPRSTQEYRGQIKNFRGKITVQ